MLRPLFIIGRSHPGHSVAAVTATNRLQPPPAIGHSRNLLWFGLAIGRLPDAWLNGLDGLTTAM
jgi:hypothetical protein